MNFDLIVDNLDYFLVGAGAGGGPLGGLALTLWMSLVACGLASLFGLAGAFLADPGPRPATWAGWNILFLALVVCLPCALAILGLLLGTTGSLPGTRRT